MPKELKESLTYEDILAANIAKANKEAIEIHNQSMIELANNPTFVESQRIIKAQEIELIKVNSMITQVNAIKPLVVGDGRKFKVNCFPISNFGTGLGQVMGLIAASRSAFTDEMSLTYSAITNVPAIELETAALSMGSPAYYKDGQVFEAIPGNFAELAPILESIFIKLGLIEFKASAITKDKFDLWFANSESAAMKKLVAFEAAATVATTKFTLED